MQLKHLGATKTLVPFLLLIHPGIINEWSNMVTNVLECRCGADMLPSFGTSDISANFSRSVLTSSFG